MTENNGWIKVTDKLPKLNQECLVFARNSINDPMIGSAIYCDVGFRDGATFRCLHISGYEWDWEFDFYKPTHWKPQPDEPIE